MFAFLWLAMIVNQMPLAPGAHLPWRAVPGSVHPLSERAFGAVQVSRRVMVFSGTYVHEKLVLSLYQCLLLLLDVAGSPVGDGTRGVAGRSIAQIMTQQIGSDQIRIAAGIATGLRVGIGVDISWLNLSL
jgi:hypothetical protein